VAGWRAVRRHGPGRPVRRGREKTKSSSAREDEIHAPGSLAGEGRGWTPTRRFEASLRGHQVGDNGFPEQTLHGKRAVIAAHCRDDAKTAPHEYINQGVPVRREFTGAVRPEKTAETAARTDCGLEGVDQGDLDGRRPAMISPRQRFQAEGPSRGPSALRGQICASDRRDVSSGGWTWTAESPKKDRDQGRRTGLILL